MAHQQHDLLLPAARNATMFACNLYREDLAKGDVLLRTCTTASEARLWADASPARPAPAPPPARALHLPLWPVPSRCHLCVQRPPGRNRMRSLRTASQIRTQALRQRIAGGGGACHRRRHSLRHPPAAIETESVCIIALNEAYANQDAGMRPFL